MDGEMKSVMVATVGKAEVWRDKDGDGNGIQDYGGGEAATVVYVG